MYKEPGRFNSTAQESQTLLVGRETVRCFTEESPLPWTFKYGQDELGIPETQSHTNPDARIWSKV